MDFGSISEMTDMFDMWLFTDTILDFNFPGLANKYTYGYKKSNVKCYFGT